MSYKEYKISVIVPVYQVENYLERCLNSIISQTYNNLEIIIVDDGSTDKSCEIADRFASLDNRVFSFHKENGGLSSARNYGLKKATGDFVSFVDSDDWIEESLYEVCVDFLNKRECDVVDFRVKTTSDYINNKNINSSISYEIVEGNNIIRDYLYRGQKEATPFSVCRKLYLRKLFDNIEFPEGKVNEDISTNFIILKSARSLIKIDYIGYYYFNRMDSITKGKFSLKDEDLIFESNKLFRLAKETNDKYCIYLAEVKLYRSYFSLLSKIAVYGYDESIKNIREITKKYISELRKGYFKLMKSPMKLNRKILVTLFLINYDISKKFIGKLK